MKNADLDCVEMTLALRASPFVIPTHVGPRFFKNADLDCVEMTLDAARVSPFVIPTPRRTQLF